MSGLREAAERIVHGGSFATPNADRKLACERAASGLVGRVIGTVREIEEWDTFLKRIGVLGR